MAKQITYTGTVIKGSNKLIASNEADLSFLRDNSYVTVKGQDYFYKIVGKDKSLYIKDAEVKSDDSLSVLGEDRFNFCVNDSVTFTHKQYTVSDAEIDKQQMANRSNSEFNTQGLPSTALETCCLALFPISTSVWMCRMQN